MKNIFYLNTIIYLLTISLYIYQPIYGGLSQIGLGLFQLVIAIKLSLERNQDISFGYKCLKIYWYSLLIWLIGLFTFIFSSLIKANQVLLFVIPMIIGFYFVIITYLIQKSKTS